jgi:hypothetical protein
VITITLIRIALLLLYGALEICKFVCLKVGMSTTGRESWASNGSDDGKNDAPDTAGEIEDTDAFAAALARSGRPNLAPLDPNILARIDPLIAGDNRMVADAVINMCQDDKVNGSWMTWLSNVIRRTVGEMKDDLFQPIVAAQTLMSDRLADQTKKVENLTTTAASFNPQDILTEVANLRRENNEMRSRLELAEKEVTTMRDLHKDAYTGMVQIYNEFKDSNRVTNNDERDRLQAEVARLTAQLTIGAQGQSAGTQQVRPPVSMTPIITSVRVDKRPSTSWMDLRTRYRPQLAPGDAMSRFQSGER